MRLTVLGDDYATLGQRLDGDSLPEHHDMPRFTTEHLFPLMRYCRRLLV